MATVDINTKSAIDVGGKILAAGAAFGLMDTLAFGGVVTPDLIKPFLGLIVCTGAAVVAWRLVKP
jgi:hypothetical protein